MHCLNLGDTMYLIHSFLDDSTKYIKGIFFLTPNSEGNIFLGANITNLNKLRI